INRRKMDGYIRSWSEFSFLPGVTESLARLSPFFDQIILVTNQRGISKGLMSEADLEEIHHRMAKAIRQAGGRIDLMLHAPEGPATDHKKWRKPEIGMALAARDRFPQLSFSQSIMVGDTFSDMEFARTAGMHAIWLNAAPEQWNKAPWVGAFYASLSDWTENFLLRKLWPDGSFMI
ncbi:MAG: HAD-IIIA family hydrolase, partial [Bacteroidota bacterium]